MAKKKKELTTKVMRTKIILYIFALPFALAGMYISLAGIMNLPKCDWETRLVILLLLLPMGGGLMGYYFGIRLIIEGIRDDICIMRGNFHVVKDYVTNAKVLYNGADDPNRAGIVFLKDYNTKNKKGITLSRYEAERTNPGNEYYVIYENKSERVVGIYSAKEYVYRGECRVIKKERDS